MQAKSTESCAILRVFCVPCAFSARFCASLEHGPRLRCEGGRARQTPPPKKPQVSFLRTSITQALVSTHHLSHASKLRQQASPLAAMLAPYASSYALRPAQHRSTSLAQSRRLRPRSDDFPGSFAALQTTLAAVGGAAPRCLRSADLRQLPFAMDSLASVCSSHSSPAVTRPS